MPDWQNLAPGFQPIAVFTLETNKSSWQTNCLRRTSSVKPARINFRTNKPSVCPSLKRFWDDDLSIQTNKSTKVRREFTQAAQIDRRFVRLWWENDQWEAKVKPIAPCTRDFSRALNKLQVIAMNSHWFIALFAAVVIGRRNSFGIRLSTVLWDPLYVLTTGTYYNNLLLTRYSCSVTLTRWYSYVIDAIRGRQPTWWSFLWEIHETGSHR